MVLLDQPTPNQFYCLKQILLWIQNQMAQWVYFSHRPLFQRCRAQQISLNNVYFELFSRRKALSRPPEPRIRIFMLVKVISVEAGFFCPQKFSELFVTNYSGAEDFMSLCMFTKFFPKNIRNFSQRSVYFNRC